MVEHIITDYSFSPSTNQITINQVEFATISLEEVKSIFNASAGIWLYNSEIGKNGVRPSTWNTFYPLESVTGGVITYTAPNAENTTTDDNLIIIVSVETASTASPSSNTIVSLFTSQAVAANTTVTSTTPTEIDQVSKLLCYVSNSGASTDCTINVYSSPTNSIAGRKKLLATFTLGDGSVTAYETGNGIDPKQLDNYIWAEIINKDIANAATITIELSVFG
jgi:hypothetical protein